LTGQAICIKTSYAVVAYSWTLQHANKPVNMDPCGKIRKRVRDLEAQLAKREAELARDQYDLFNRAYDRNPGGDLLNKGTYVGHVKVIEGYRVGLIKAIAEAKKMGCL
jgi:hypothetical protein